MVCRRTSRPVRFQTAGISICQWCITELKTTKTAPYYVLEAARTRARHALTRTGETLSPHDFRSAVESAVKAYWRQALEPARPQTEAERMLRAYRLGIVNFCQQRTERLDTDEARALATSIRRRDRWVCVICDRRPRGARLHVHHILPLKHHGTHHRSNLATLCLSCHRKQHPGVFIPDDPDDEEDAAGLESTEQ